MTLNLDPDQARAYAQVFCCKLGSFSFKYLGIPLHHSKLRKEDLQPVIDKVIKRIFGWRVKILSYGGKLVLLKTCISWIPTYLMSFIKFPNWVINAITSQMSHFFWGNLGDQHKYHLADWGLVCKKKEFGGLGIHDFRDFNLCLLASWIKRYHLSENKIWKQIVDHKYNVSNPNILWCSGDHASPFWKGVAWAAASAKVGYRWHVGDGMMIKFWEDVWFGHCCLATQFWDLYVIVNEQNCTIAEVWDGSQLKLSFRRTVDVHLLNRWFELEAIVQSVTLTNGQDAPIWMFHPSGTYSVKSFYAFVNNGGIQRVYTPVMWNIDVPPKINVFLWLLTYNKLLTRDNLAKR